MEPNQHAQSQHPLVPQFNANVSPFVMHPPFTAPPWNNWQALAPNDPSKMFNNSKIDPNILAKATEWTEHRAPDGRPYYYNAAHGESTWDRPQALKDMDEARNAANRMLSLPHQQPPMMMTQGNITFDNSGNMISNSVNNKRQAELDAEKEKKRKEEAAKQPARPQDKSRPISSTAIQGTPWCVVWTGDSRVFFYNPSTRTSVWERPEDLIGKSLSGKRNFFLLKLLFQAELMLTKLLLRFPMPFVGQKRLRQLLLNRLVDLPLIQVEKTSIWNRKALMREVKRTKKMPCRLRSRSWKVRKCY